MKKVFLFCNAAFAAFFLSCTGNKSSEACDYQQIEFRAKIVDIDVVYTDNPKDTLYDIILEFDASSLSAERQSMNRLRDVDVDYETLQRNNFQIGNIYTGTVSELISGKCKERYVSFNQGLK